MGTRRICIACFLDGFWAVTVNNVKYHPNNKNPNRHHSGDNRSQCIYLYIMPSLAMVILIQHRTFTFCRWIPNLKSPIWYATSKNRLITWSWGTIFPIIKKLLCTISKMNRWHHLLFHMLIRAIHHTIPFVKFDCNLSRHIHLVFYKYFRVTATLMR